MDLKRLEAQRLIEKASFSFKQITSNLNRAQRDLRTAKANLRIDEEWAYTIVYHAMLRAGRALMFACGYRPKGRDQHKTVVEFSIPKTEAEKSLQSAEQFVKEIVARIEASPAQERLFKK